jgi:uncharacterized membrane protein
LGHAAHGAPVTVTRPTAQVLTAIAVVLGVLTAVGVIVLRSTEGDDDGATRQVGLVSRVYEATVVSSERRPCRGTTEADRIPCDLVLFRLTEGPDQGDTRAQEFPESPTTPDLNPGEKVVLGFVPDAEPGFRYQYLDRQRRPVLLLVALIFAVAVVMLGRLRGVAALIGLAGSVVVLLTFVIPELVDGHSPVLVAVIGSSAIAYLALYLANGFRTQTTVALLGTLAALGLTVILASIFTSLAEISGFASEEALLVLIGDTGIDLSGLVLGGMVIGALGALDDVTVTQSAAVWELRGANPDMKRRELFGSAMRIGRDHVASTVNTLALAYAGSALPLLILFTQSRQSLGTVANSETVATEILAALVGSIGLVASVPVTTWLAARVVGQAQLRPSRGGQ